MSAGHRPSRRTAGDSGSAFNNGRTSRVCPGARPNAREEAHEDH